MSARGAADFMTRMTQILGGLFVALSILLAALAVKSGSAQTVDDRSTARCPPLRSRPRPIRWARPRPPPRRTALLRQRRSIRWPARPKVSIPA
jgi:preprotein translocase subunit SecG